MSHKSWNNITIALIVIALTLFGLVTVVIDPFFQYHKPLEQLQYPIPANLQRYYSFGIAKNFDYELLITGSSVTENFKPSEFEQLFDEQAVKLSIAAANEYEIDLLIEAALKANDNLKTVIYNTNTSMYLTPIDYEYDSDHPTHLYDNNYFNDVSYLFNKDVLFDFTLKVIEYTKQGGKTPTFDDYSYWHDTVFDGDAFLNGYSVWNVQKTSVTTLSEQDKKLIIYNLEKGIFDIAKRHPDVTFILFFPPNSVLWWNDADQLYPVSYWIERKAFVIEQLLTVPNIKTYFFMGESDITFDFSKYIDTVHYSPDVNSWMAQEFTKDTYLLTKDNYQEILQDTQELYENFDYETLLANRPV